MPDHYLALDLIVTINKHLEIGMCNSCEVGCKYTYTLCMKCL